MVNTQIHISIQRLRWLGHAFRLPENSPAKLALLEIENTPKDAEDAQRLSGYIQ